MTTDDNGLREAVARVMGWTQQANGLWHFKDNEPDYPGELLNQPLPELTLDWLAQCEATLTDEEHKDFRAHLWEITEPSGSRLWVLSEHNRAYISATASQRARAFLRVKGLMP